MNEAFGSGQSAPLSSAHTIERTFTYHAPKGTQAQRYTTLREATKSLAHLMAELCPASHELDVAIDRLSDASMWANAAIARNE